jgi:dihydrofolate reductase
MPETSAPGGAGDGVGNDWAGHLLEKGVVHGLFGEELFHGQLVTGSFVPEQHTDFILTVAGGRNSASPEANAAEIAALTSAGAYIMGRNMFGPGRGAWDEDWRGWWGEEPLYHAPVFVLSHRPRDPLTMQGGTTFTFVTDGIETALARARAAAGDGTVAIAGGAATVNQYLAAGLVDELWLHIAPLTLGVGERLFDGVDLTLEPVAARHTGLVTHVRYRVLH